MTIWKKLQYSFSTGSICDEKEKIGSETVGLKNVFQQMIIIVLNCHQWNKYKNTLKLDYSAVWYAIKD